MLFGADAVFLLLRLAVLLVKLREPGVSKLVALPREAYGRTLPFLATITLPRGLIEWLAA
jgi:hypothetical protein